MSPEIILWLGALLWFAVVGGRVKDAPSIIKWARGRKVYSVLPYFKRKQIKVTYLGEDKHA